MDFRIIRFFRESGAGDGFFSKFRQPGRFFDLGLPRGTVGIPEFVEADRKEHTHDTTSISTC
jgi:hypothetical protein